jgi:hypothetical protein
MHTHAKKIEAAAAAFARAINGATSVAPGTTDLTDDETRQLELTIAELIQLASQTLIDLGTIGADTLEAAASEIVDALDP